MLHFLSKINLRKTFTATFLVVVFCLSLSGVSYAASLSFVPNYSKVSVGNIVSVKVIVGTNGKSINNAESIVRFPSVLLDVISISKSSSIFTLWVEEPKFSNFDGTITFNGGVPNPGFIGENGEVATITFRAKKAGIASVVFSDSAVRENDGLGTDILTAKNVATIEVKANDGVEVVPSIAKGTPPAPVVTSVTHPESNKWYNNPNVELKWEVPSDVTAVSTLLSNSSMSVPTVVYDPPIGNKSISKVEDGIWYFHIRFKNKNGWGAVTHFKIQIDTTAPNQFKITFPHGTVADDPRPIAYFNTTDGLSGVNYYEVKIGEGKFMRISTQEVSSNPYAPPVQEPGTHNILVKAVDLAGNETIQTGEFTVASIKVPEIEEYSMELDEGDMLRVRGSSYPSIEVEVVVENSVGHRTNLITNSFSTGEFSAIWPKNLEEGSYQLMVRAIDKRGAKSNFTKPVNFIVKKSALVSASSLVLNWLSIIIILVLLFSGVGFIISYFLHKISLIKRRVDRKVRGVELSVHKSFLVLRESVREQVRELEQTRTRRELTKEEGKVLKVLQAAINRSEECIEKEVEEIESSIK